MRSNDDIIELVSTFMSLCTTITTEGSSTPDHYKANFHEVRQRLLSIEGLPLPRWVVFSNTPASVMAHVKSERGSGPGTWALRRAYFQQEKDTILASFIPPEPVSSRPVRPDGSVRGKDKVDVLSPSKCSTDPFIQKRKFTEAWQVDDCTISQPVAEAAHYQPVAPPVKKKVFIVHGHNDVLKYEVARLVDDLGFKSIIFHEQRSRGSQTIIQKLIALTEDVDYAIVLYTACDIGRSAHAGQEQPRARQNVVFEHGYLLSRLGPEKVMALREDGVEKPSDLDGVLYIDVQNNWKYELSKELQEHLRGLASRPA
ncbi:nucleotide-binding protein [Raoultella planticola]|uniref:TIR domain-containing protein n=1 Tax=Enterobacteriaceae TaxID=543 RepID=UPI001299804C|nr:MULTISPECIES: nucleotide-binding protein [Enterobacteriaceae]MDM9678013.1 nucleotide-binding protein [Raoultella planticola]MRG30616.1 hypothetical protein [Enterobacter cancerogenus]QZS63362.1 nucleotide-binding protein [Raoultella planticola]